VPGIAVIADWRPLPALRYLAGAYRAAGGNESRAIALYSRGYYNQAKAQGFSPYASSAPSTGHRHHYHA